jgi:hypothetical protein
MKAYVKTSLHGKKENKMKKIYEMPKTVHYSGEGVGVDVVPHVWCPALKDTVSQEKCNGCPLKSQYTLCKDNGTEV